MSLSEGTSAASKRSAVIVALAALAGLGAVSWSGYKIWQLTEIRKKTVAVDVKGEITPASQVSKLIEKSQTNEQQVVINDLKNQKGDLQGRMEGLLSENVNLKTEIERLRASSKNIQPAEYSDKAPSSTMGGKPGKDNLPSLPLPPPPPPPDAGGQDRGFIGRIFPAPPGIPANMASNAAPKPESRTENNLFGGTFGGGSPASPVEKDAGKRKPRQPTIKLPSNSFGTAYIFAGGMAPTVLEGQAKGVRLLMRIATPTQLPNRVRSNLIGCFLQGAATGNIQAERADVVLTRISCVDRRKRGVIDQKIEGWVTGSDGVAGVKGPMVSELEKTLGRGFIAGMFKSAGQTLQAGSMTLSTFGTTNMDPNKAMQNTVAGGAAEASNLVAQLYMKLAQLQMPVVAVGSGVKVGYVIGDGVELAINDYCDDDNLLDERELGCEEYLPSAD